MKKNNIKNINEICDKIISLIEQSRQSVAKNINSAMVFTYYNIGKMLVDEWQQGEKRAEYGKQLLAKVSTDLTKKYGKGFSVQNLERMRSFFLIYSDSSKELRDSEVFQKSSTVSRISEVDTKSPTVSRISGADKKSSTVSRISDDDYVNLLPISWSHYSFLIRIKDEIERQFYEVESFQNQWSVRELYAIVEITLPENNRQIFASQYETILPSKKQFTELLNFNINLKL